jgi:hypothetical protein
MLLLWANPILLVLAKIVGIFMQSIYLTVFSWVTVLACLETLPSHAMISTEPAAKIAPNELLCLFSF